MVVAARRMRASDNHQSPRRPEGGLAVTGRLSRHIGAWYRTRRASARLIMGYLDCGPEERWDEVRPAAGVTVCARRGRLRRVEFGFAAGGEGGARGSIVRGGSLRAMPHGE